DPRVGIVFQANKRDCPDAVPLASLRSMLDEVGPIGLVESVATTGTGVREAFVFAVRLALDRVRELSRCGRLPTARPTIDGPDDLIAQLQASEQGSLDLAAASDLEHIRTADLQPQQPVRSSSSSATAPANLLESGTDRPPALPNERVASGLIWPP